MDFEKLKLVRQNKNLFCKKLNISVEEVRLGYAKVRKEVATDDVNPIGLPHGGLYFTMADHAAGTAMASHGYQAVTLNSTFNFFRFGKVGDTLTAEARETKHGNTICVFDVDVRDQNDTLLAGGTFTFFRMEKELEL